MDGRFRGVGGGDAVCEDVETGYGDGDCVAGLEVDGWCSAYADAGRLGSSSVTGIDGRRTEGLLFQ